MQHPIPACLVLPMGGKNFVPLTSGLFPGAALASLSQALLRLDQGDRFQD